MLHVVDGAPITACCGTWPVARTPFAHGWLRCRFVDTVATLDALLVLPWVVVHCPACRQRITV